MEDNKTINFNVTYACGKQVKYESVCMDNLMKYDFFHAKIKTFNEMKGDVINIVYNHPHRPVYDDLWICILTDDMEEVPCDKCGGQLFISPETETRCEIISLGNQIGRKNKLNIVDMNDILMAIYFFDYFMIDALNNLLVSYVKNFVEAFVALNKLREGLDDVSDIYRITYRVKLRYAFKDLFLPLHNEKRYMAHKCVKDGFVDFFVKHHVPIYKLLVHYDSVYWVTYKKLIDISGIPKIQLDYSEFFSELSLQEAVKLESILELKNYYDIYNCDYFTVGNEETNNKMVIDPYQEVINKLKKIPLINALLEKNIIDFDNIRIGIDYMHRLLTSNNMNIFLVIIDTKKTIISDESLINNLGLNEGVTFGVVINDFVSKTYRIISHSALIYIRCPIIDETSGYFFEDTIMMTIKEMSLLHDINNIKTDYSFYKYDVPIRLLNNPTLNKEDKSYILNNLCF